MTFNSESVDWTVFMYFVGNPNKCLAYQSHLRNRQAYVHKGLKGYRYVVAIAFRTFYGAFELAMHEIYYYWLAAFEMVLPRFLTCLEVILTMIFYHRNQRFFFDSIEIFVQAVKKNVQEFLWVLLL